MLRDDVPAEAEAGDPLELRQRSALAVPLITRGRLVGFFYADLRTVFGRFSQAKGDVVGSLGNQAATALENARAGAGPGAARGRAHG